MEGTFGDAAGGVLLLSRETCERSWNAAYGSISTGFRIGAQGADLSFAVGCLIPAGIFHLLRSYRNKALSMLSGLLSLTHLAPIPTGHRSDLTHEGKPLLVIPVRDAHIPGDFRAGMDIYDISGEPKVAPVQMLGLCGGRCPFRHDAI